VTEDTSIEPTSLVSPVRRRLIVGASWTFVTRVAALGIGMVLSVFIARMFGPQGSGTYALAANCYGALLILAPLGLPTGASYMVSHGTWSLRAALIPAHAAAVGLGLIGGALGYAVYSVLRDSALSGITPTMAVLVVIAAPFGIAASVSIALLLARSAYERVGFLQIFQILITVVLSVGLALPFGLPGLIAGFAAASVPNAVVSGMLLRRLVRSERDGTRVDAGADAGGLRRSLRFGVKAWGADALQFLNYRLDLFVLSVYVSRAELGVYAVAVSLTMLAWLPAGALQQVLFPRTANLAAAVRDGEMTADDADAAAARVLRHSTIILAPTAIGMAAILLIGVPVLYGPSFAQTTTLGLLLLPGVLALAWAKVASAVMTGRDRPIYGVYAGLIDVPVTIALYLLLIPPLGADGAALASSASYLTTTLVGLFLYRKVTSLPLRASVMPQRADILEYGVWLRSARAHPGRWRSGKRAG
jgi:O-antigen/teichoic acid export membrane protein